MAFLLRYRYRPGQQLQHRSTSTVVVELPDGSKQATRTVQQLKQQVLRLAPQGYLIELRTQLEHSEGTVAFEAQPWTSVQMVVGERGGEPPLLPLLPVAEGSRWEVNRQTPEGEPLPTLFQLEKVQDGVAHLVGCSLLERPDGSEMEVQMCEQLDLASGVTLHSQTVMKVRRADGTVISSLVELEQIAP